MNVIKQQRTKLLSIVLTFAMVISIFSIIPLSTSAAEINDTFPQGGLTYTVTGNTEGSCTVKVSAYDGVKADVVIPSTVEDNGVTYTVTDITAATSVFRNKTNITSVNIPGTVKTIASNCFNGCTSLKKVTLNEGTKEIGMSAFIDDTALTDINFPLTITKINDNSFKNTGLQTVTLKNLSVGTSFNNCTSLTRINVYAKTSLYPTSAKPFTGCTAVKDVYFYDKAITTTKISNILSGANASLTIHGFKGSTAQTYASSNSVTFKEITQDEITPETGPFVERYIFTEGHLTYEVQADTSTVSVVSFDNSAELVIPESVNHSGSTFKVVNIYNVPFQGNTNITSVNIPGSVKKIDSSCFSNCTSLATVTLNEGTEEIGSSTFSKTALTKIQFPSTIKEIGNSAFNYTKIEELTLKNVSTQASFNNIETLKTVNIYENVKFGNGSQIFNGCNNIKDVYCYDRETTFSIATFKNTNTTLTIHGYANSTAEEYATNNKFNFVKMEETSTDPLPEPKGTVIKQDPFTFTVTDNRASSPAVSLTAADDTIQKNLEIPASINHKDFTYSVTSIGNDVFKERDITSVNIPATLTSIGDNCFKGCTSITSLDIPGTVNNIGESCFQNCTSLAKITLNKGIYKLGAHVFQNTAISSIDIPGSVSSISVYCFADCASLTTVTLNEGTTTINSFAFANIPISKIEFPDSITKITNDVFSNTKLEEVTLKDVDLNMSSFGMCKSLKTINLYGRITLTNSAPFSGCSAIENVYFYDKDTSIPAALLTSTNSTLTVHGYTNSTAQTYATENGFKFEPFDPVETEPTSAPTTEETEPTSAPTTEETEPTTAPETKETEPTSAPTTEKTEPTTAPATQPNTQPSTLPSDYVEVLLGDAFSDGSVNIKDASYIQLYIASLLNVSESPIDLIAADIDDDGLNIKDVSYIQMWCASLKVDYKIGEVVQKEAKPVPDKSASKTAPDPVSAPDPMTAAEPEIRYNKFV